jgi:ADP-heptose:LPS heptosyltransferase
MFGTTDIDKEHRAKVILGCEAALIPLFSSLTAVDCLVAEGSAIPPFDVHASLMSLPGIFRTRCETIPAKVPYLFADAALAAEWTQRLERWPEFRIGINWRGRPGKGSYRQRDIPLDCFARLARLPGVQLISLQQGAGREELAAAGQRLQIVDLGDDVDTLSGPFMDTAAIMMNLDLIITSDTSIPHLAGALGRPVWLALPFTPDWRWLLGRSDSPWYPTMRLFRQPRPGHWNRLFDEINAALCKRLSN